jgi:hypothetical protein
MYRFAQQVYCFAGNPKAVKIGMTKFSKSWILVGTGGFQGLVK